MEAFFGEYIYKGYNDGKLHATGHAIYSKKYHSFVLIFKIVGMADNVGYAICSLGDGTNVKVKTLHPDGSYRWDGTLKKE